MFQNQLCPVSLPEVWYLLKSKKEEGLSGPYLNRLTTQLLFQRLHATSHCDPERQALGKAKHCSTTEEIAGSPAAEEKVPGPLARYSSKRLKSYCQNTRCLKAYQKQSIFQDSRRKMQIFRDKSIFMALFLVKAVSCLLLTLPGHKRPNRPNLSRANLIPTDFSGKLKFKKHLV